MSRGGGRPTGVDRVDLNYALWLQANSSQLIGIVQTVRGFRALASSELDALLRGRSFSNAGGGGGRVADLQSGRVARFIALLEKFRRVEFCEVWRERGLLPAIVSRLPFRRRAAAFPEGDWSGWTYVNVGHCFRFEAAMESIPDEMKRLYFLHDVIPMTHPETQKATSRAHFRKFCEYVGHPNSQVVVSSQATIDAIGSLPERERVLLDSVASIQVAPLAVEERFQAERLKGLKVKREENLKAEELKRVNVEGLKGAGYFLSVGTIEPRKNLQLLVEVWEQLLATGSEIPKLIWVGKFGWSCDRQLMRRFERLQKKGVAELRSGVSDAELLELMDGAQALLFPSKVEGWGLPLSEALARGLPVIASDIPVFREVGQGVPDLIAPDDVVGWRSAIANYSQPESDMRRAQMSRMADYQPISWEQHFDCLKALGA